MYLRLSALTYLMVFNAFIWLYTGLEILKLTKGY